MKRQMAMCFGLFAVVSGCATQDIDIGPMDYDAGGTMPCSAGEALFDDACGWRVIRGDGTAEIWIASIAVSDRPAYRVLNLANGEFTTTDGATLDYRKDDDSWIVSVPGQEYYRFPESFITGG